MHYGNKRTAKVKSSSFYISESLNDKLNFLSEFEGQSRSIIVELCVNFYLGEKNGDFAKLQRKYYKKRRGKGKRKVFKKSLYTSQENEPSLWQEGEWL